MAESISPASRSRIRVAQIVETVRGQTPATGDYKVLPHLDNTALNQTQTFERSAQVKSNRQGGKQIGGTVQSGGTIAVPLMNDPGVLELFESGLSGLFTNVVASGAGGNTSGFSLSTNGGAGGNNAILRTGGSFKTDGWQVGDRVVIASPTTAGNEVLLADEVTVSGVADTILTLNSTIAITATEAFGATTTATSQTKYAKAGTARKTFTHEVTYEDLDPVVYEYFRGDEVNTVAITVPTSGEVTAEMAMIGLIGKITQTEFDRSNNLSGTTTAGTHNRLPYSGSVAFAGSVEGCRLERGGVASPDVESMSININNNRAARFSTGQASASFVEEGDFDVEMTFALYFSDMAVQAQYLAGTRTSLMMVLVDQQDGHRMIIELPNIVFTAAEKAISGQTVVQNVSAYAEEDPVLATKMRVWVQPGNL